MTESREEPVFSDSDLRLLRYTAVALTGLLFAGLIGAVVWVLAWLVSYFYNVLLPLSIGGVLALLLYPVVPKLERRLRLSRVGAVVVLSVSFLVVVGAALTVVVQVAIVQTREFVSALPDLLGAWEEHFPALAGAIVELLEDGGEGNGAEQPLGDIPGTIMALGGLLVGLGFVPLYIIFALLAGDRMQIATRDALTVFRPDTAREILALGQMFLNYVTAFFRGQLLIALTTGLLLAAGFTIIGLQPAVLLGLAIGLLSIVPYLGSIAGVLILLPIIWLQPDAGVERLLLTLAVFAVVQLFETLVLRPNLMANRVGLHPVVVIISIFFWGTALGGVIGMILAVPLTAFVATLWRHTQHRYMQRVVIGGDTTTVGTAPNLVTPGDAQNPDRPKDAST